MHHLIKLRLPFCFKNFFGKKLLDQFSRSDLVDFKILHFKISYSFITFHLLKKGLFILSVNIYQAPITC